MHVLIICLVAQLMLLGACGTSTTPDGSSQEEDQASESDSGEIEDSSQNEIDEGENTEIDDNNMPTSAEILEALGAEGVEGADPNAVASYQNMFNGLDSNGDSIVTVEEYIAFGHFDEEKARAIFAASDRDQNGEMTQDEYVENRIITDEAKLIFEGLDTNQDGNLLESEFVENAAFEDPISSAVYALFDANGDGELMVPEYLQVWGAWARGEEYP